MALAQQYKVLTLFYFHSIYFMVFWEFHLCLTPQGTMRSNLSLGNIRVIEFGRNFPILSSKNASKAHTPLEAQCHAYQKCSSYYDGRVIIQFFYSSHSFIVVNKIGHKAKFRMIELYIPVFDYFHFMIAEKSALKLLYNPQVQPQ